MKTVISVFSFAMLLSFSIFSKDTSDRIKTQNAVTSIQQWLGLVDSGSYSASWSSTGKIFKNQLSDEMWSGTLEKSRKPLGKIITRKVNSSKFHTSLPGVPDGEYVVAQFKSEFENKKKAIETVTAVFEEETWKVVGYFIK